MLEIQQRPETRCESRGASVARQVPIAWVIGAAALLGLLAVLLMPSAPAFGAQTQDCPSEQSLLPANKNNPPFLCAQMENSGKKSLNPWQSKTWGQDLPLGYDVIEDCRHPNDSAVSVTSVSYGPSFSATGTNWGTTDHSFGAGALFATEGIPNSDSYVKDSCDKTGAIKTSIEKRTGVLALTGGYDKATVGVVSTITGTLDPSSAPGTCATETSDPLGPTFPANGATGCVLLYLDTAMPDPNVDTPVGLGTVSSGKVTINWKPQPGTEGSHLLTALYSGDTLNCPSTSSTCGYSPSVSIQYPVEISSSGTTSSATPAAAQPGAATTGPEFNAALGGSVVPAVPAGPNPVGLTTLTKSRRMPHRLALRCPLGSVLMYAETLSPGEAPLAYSRRGVHVLSGEVRSHRRVAIQVTCRTRSAPRLLQPLLDLGTPHRDRITTGTRAGARAFAGPGNDLIRVRSAHGLGNGGLGADRIVIAAGSGVASGGPGADRLIARTTQRTMLIGGPGDDVLIGSRGTTLINAADGSRDLVICHGDHNRVLADNRDRLVGPCRRVSF